MGWPRWLIWKPGFPGPTTRFIQGRCVSRGGVAASETFLQPWLRFLRRLLFRRDLGGSMTPGLRSTTNPISWMLVSSARNHSVITETSSCTVIVCDPSFPRISSTVLRDSAISPFPICLPRDSAISLVPIISLFSLIYLPRDSAISLFSLISNTHSISIRILKTLHLFQSIHSPLSHTISLRSRRRSSSSSSQGSSTGPSNTILKAPVALMDELCSVRSEHKSAIFCITSSSCKACKFTFIHQSLGLCFGLRVPQSS